MKRRPSQQTIRNRQKRLECEDCGKTLLVETNKVVRQYQNLDYPNNRLPKGVRCPNCEKYNEYEQIKEYIKKAYNQ